MCTGRMSYAFVMYNNLDKWLSPAATSCSQPPPPAAAAAAAAADDDDDECLSKENVSRECSSCRQQNRVVNSNIISIATSSSSTHSINLTEPITFTLRHIDIDVRLRSLTSHYH